MSRPTRRAFLKGASGSLVTAALAATNAQLAQAADRSVYTRGTTLEQAAAPVATSGYTRLTAGPGYPLVVRADLTEPRPSRDDTRTGLASIVQFTDLHVVDAQSPVRFEFLNTVNSSACRPQEALGTQGAAQLVERVNDLAKGPFTGRRFDCVVSTGDNTDNHEHVELEWYLAVMNGGVITPNTGASDRWEGAQTSGNPQYYNVENASVRDRYVSAGFPVLDGFFRRATAAHRSPGLNVRWFSVFGNHDDSVSGVLPSDWGALAAMYTGDVKFTGFTSGTSDAALRRTFATGSTAIKGVSSSTKNTWHVTPDERRRPFTPTEYMRAHLPSGGHGFTDENVATGRGYYTFRIADGVTGISLDSTNRAGFTEGSLGHEQFLWLQRVLTAGSSTYVDFWGRTQRHAVADEMFVIFSHHTSTTMTNVLLDPATPELRHAGREVRDTLMRFPNVVAWVNGHTHENRITAHRHADPRRSFWEINTASHVDFPQHARIIELCDNTDGTLSLFTTLVESAAPYAASTTGQGQADLASLYRELSYNDPNRSAALLGADADRNTELILRHPWR